MFELKKAKTELRNELLERRKSIPEAEKAVLDRKIADYFLSSVSYRYSQAVLVYSATQFEVDTAFIIETALNAGKIVAYPVCDTATNTITFRVIKSAGDLVSGAYDIPEPSAECQDFAQYCEDYKRENSGKNLLSVCLVPCLAFDKDGYRIGYGKGYYDRFLSEYDGAKIGLCNAQFRLQSLPSGKYDVKLDVCITENGVVSFKK